MHYCRAFHVGHFVKALYEKNEFINTVLSYEDKLLYKGLYPKMTLIVLFPMR